ncbi:MAG: ATP-binding protein [Desulfobacterales bacterium]|nr:ATP-binding protein [Desulfobacterales bacterium]
MSVAGAMKKKLTRGTANFIEVFKIKILRNILVASIIIAAILLITDVLLIYPAFTRMIIKNSEEEILKIANLITHTRIPQKKIELSRASLSTRVTGELAKLSRELGLMKLQIFSKSGETIYSTDPEDIGTMHTNRYFYEVVVKGSVYTRIRKKDTQSLEGQRVIADVFETYVPIIVNDAIIGVLEIYYDYSQKKERLDKLLLRSRVILSTVTIIMLGVIIFLLAKGAQDVARRKKAEEEVRNARDTLEQRVKERTTELGKTNEQLIQEINNRKHIEDKLRKSGERFQALTESTSDWIWEVDANIMYTYASPKVRDFLGYEPGEVIGKTPFDFMPIDEAKSIRLAFHAIVDSQKPFSKLKNINIHKEGKLITLETSGVPIFDSSGQLSGYRGIARDITEEEKLRWESEYRLKQVIQADKLASLGEVVAGVAHEINNPNSFITYDVPILEETWQMFEPLVSEYATANPQLKISGFDIEELCGDMRELIQEIKIGSDRISKIVSNLKDFARLDQSIQFQPVDVNAVIEKALAIVGAQVRQSVGKLKMKLDPNLPLIQGYFQKLEQVMINLIINAIQAIPEKDKGKLSIRTRHVVRLGSVLIEIEDNGIGMVPEVIERIFEPFFTTKRDTGGTGLGLSVSYGLIHEHNGVIGVLSRPGFGTRFSLYLPVDSKRKLELCPAILCLDNDAAFFGLLKAHFAKVRNMSTKTKNKPENIVAYLENHPEVDIVLLDIMMPGINGCALIEKIKVEFPLLAIILYSGNASKVKAAKQKPDSISAADYFLQKPVKMQQLLEIINTIGRQRL